MRLKSANDRTTKARLGATLGVTVVAAILASSASAVVLKTPTGKLGYLPLNGRGPSTPSPFDASGNLDYHGGPVMHSNTEYAIFWAPSGFSFPAGYEAASVKYLQDVAADTGKPTNVYSVGTQYTDTTGAHAAYATTFGGSFDDATAYPTTGNCSVYTGAPPAFTRCLTDAQIAAEVNSFVAAHSLPRGLTADYFVFLPDNVGSCFSNVGPPSNSNPCFDTQFCAYHNHTNTSGTETLYANESFTPRDPAGCGNGQYPNGHANGNVDDQLSTLSHEANETITDPLLNAWFDNNNGGQENGDQCRNTGDDYGPPLGGAPGALFNQLINGTGYILQQEWSNHVTGCQQRYSLTASASGPSSGRTGQALAFTASGTDGDGGTVTGVTVSFGDGTSASGTSVSHAYSAPGTYPVTATITNSTGLTTTATGPTVTITAPPPPSNSIGFGKVKLNKQKGTAKLPVTVQSAGALTLGGKGIKPIHKANVSDKAVGPGTTKLTVKAKGKAAKTLKKKGKVKVVAKVTFKPTGGTAKTRSKKIRLIKKS